MAGLPYQRAPRGRQPLRWVAVVGIGVAAIVVASYGLSSRVQPGPSLSAVEAETFPLTPASSSLYRNTGPVARDKAAWHRARAVP